MWYKYTSGVCVFCIREREREGAIVPRATLLFARSVVPRHFVRNDSCILSLVVFMVMAIMVMEANGWMDLHGQVCAFMRDACSLRCIYLPKGFLSIGRGLPDVDPHVRPTLPVPSCTHDRIITFNLLPKERPTYDALGADFRLGG